jgi:hypothetical protein
VRKYLVDFGGRKPKNGVARLGVVLNPREGELFLLLDRHKKIRGLQLARSLDCVSGKERVVPGRGVIKREEEARHTRRSLEVVALEGAGSEVFLYPVVDPFVHARRHDVKPLKVGKDGEGKTVEEKNSFDQRGVLFASYQFSHTGAEFTVSSVEHPICVHLEAKKNSQIDCIVLSLNLWPGGGKKKGLHSRAVLESRENDCFLGVDHQPRSRAEGDKDTTDREEGFRGTEEDTRVIRESPGHTISDFAEKIDHNVGTEIVEQRRERATLLDATKDRN